MHEKWSQRSTKRAVWAYAYTYYVFYIAKKEIKPFQPGEKKTHTKKPTSFP